MRMLDISHLVVVVDCHLVPGEDGDSGHQAGDASHDRMVDCLVLSVVHQEQVIGFVTQRPPELNNISELHWNVQHQVLKRDSMYSAQI